MKMPYSNQAGIKNPNKHFQVASRYLLLGGLCGVPQHASGTTLGPSYHRWDCFHRFQDTILPKIQYSTAYSYLL
jgi:hypothetical protein